MRVYDAIYSGFAYGSAGLLGMLFMPFCWSPKSKRQK